VPPKNLLKVYGIMFGVALVAVIAVVMIVIATGDSTKHLPSRGDLVRVQVRSFPAMQPVQLGTHPEGKTPKMLLVPRSDDPIAITVIMNGKPVVKQVVPDDDKVVDFKE
jgi:hypothetical protein